MKLLPGFPQGYYLPTNGNYPGDGGQAKKFDINMAVSSGGGTDVSSTQFFELYDNVSCTCIHIGPLYVMKFLPTSLHHMQWDGVQLAMPRLHRRPLPCGNQHLSNIAANFMLPK